MKSLLPNTVELTILAAVAVICAAFANRLAPEEGSLALLAFPLLLVALLMGARRTWKPQEAREIARTQPEKASRRP